MSYVFRSSSSLDPNLNEPQTASSQEVKQLKAHIEALEQLIEVYEQETLEKSVHLERTLNDLQHHTQRLSYAEATLTTLRTLLNGLGDAVIVVNQQGEFLLVNIAAKTLLHLPLGCPSLWHWAKSWPLLRSASAEPYTLDTFPLTRALAGEIPEPEEILVRAPETGEETWFQVTARALGGEGQDSWAGERSGGGGIVIFHNITSLKATESALRESESRSRLQAQELRQTLKHLQKVQGQLIQTEKMSSLGQLVAGIAHEINNPVNFIHGNLTHVQLYADDLLLLVELLLENPANQTSQIQDQIEAMELDFLREDLPKVLASMRVGTERIRQLVLSLRNFSRLDQAETKAVDLHEGLESTLLLLKGRLKAKDKQAKVVVQRHYGPLPLVVCYPAQLNQVFMNLLVNALDAIEARAKADRAAARVQPSDPPSPLGQITITTREIDRHGQAWVEVQIADDGMGMSPEVQGHIFDPFFTTKPIGQGTGMGMSIAYQIVVDRHGGTLACCSELGQGTTFKLRIPVQGIAANADAST